MRYIFSLTLSEIQLIPTPQQCLNQCMQHRATHTMSFSEHTQSTKREHSEKMFEINISTQVGNPPVQHFVSSLIGAAIHFFFIPAKTIWDTLPPTQPPSLLPPSPAPPTAPPSPSQAPPPPIPSLQYQYEIYKHQYIQFHINSHLKR